MLETSQNLAIGFHPTLFRLISNIEICLRKKFTIGGVNMTRMQVEWQNADENVRHNKAMEEETNRHNVESERLTAEQNSLRQAELNETHRSNITREALTQRELNETIRHQQQMDAETMRHNGASEQEITRHNKAAEDIDRAANTVKILTSQISAAATRDAANARAEATKYSADINKITTELRIAAETLWRKAENDLKEKDLTRRDRELNAKIREMERRYFLDYDKFRASLDEAQRRYAEDAAKAKTEADKRKATEIYRTVVRRGIDNLTPDTLDVLEDLYDLIHNQITRAFGEDKADNNNVHSRGSSKGGNP